MTEEEAVAEASRCLGCGCGVVGAIAAVLALRAQSVQALWYFTSDLVFVLLFPQLVAAHVGDLAAGGVAGPDLDDQRRAAARRAAKACSRVSSLTCSTAACRVSRRLFVPRTTLS